MGPPKGPNRPLRASMWPLEIQDRAPKEHPKGPNVAPKGPRRSPIGAFCLSLGAEVEPLPSPPRAPCFSFFLFFFNTPIRHWSGLPGPPLRLSWPHYFDFFGSFLPFSKTQTAPSFPFTAFSWAPWAFSFPIGLALGPIATVTPVTV
jgi:hypothetical protein